MPDIKHGGPSQASTPEQPVSVGSFALPHYTRVQRAAQALEAEVRKRNEWYGLDNWTFGEVATFVLAAAAEHEHSDYELVRVSRELVEKLLAQEPQPVVLSGLERHEDGTIELWFRTPEGPA